jgi:hypothetical protein
MLKDKKTKKNTKTTKKNKAWGASLVQVCCKLAPLVCNFDASLMPLWCNFDASLMPL